ncbi:hypothetical protein [Acidiphilium sp.]|uniref:hypothetical protein n=1 Tax=Acidiphilium sp. TaxID=527 RepID=UPI00259036EF|nr:hypothetical protein [Acidiphilium sp.]
MTRPALRMPPPALADDAARARIASLETDVEYWRQRAETAEAALKGGLEWDLARPPLTLAETRILRLMARRHVGAEAIVSVMQQSYPKFDTNSLKVRCYHMRRKLPHCIAPSYLERQYAPHTIPDLEACQAFLDTGRLPE